jgi:hypothetical protein
MFEEMEEGPITRGPQDINVVGTETFETRLCDGRIA